MNYYLCPVDNKTITIKNLYILHETVTIDYPADLLLPLKVNERIFLLQTVDECLLPYEFGIVSINRGSRNLVLKVFDVYQNALPFAALALLLPAQMLRNYVQLTNLQVAGVKSLMNVESFHFQSEQDVAEVEEENIEPDGSSASVTALNALNDTLSDIGQQLKHFEEHFEQSLANQNPQLHPSIDQLSQTLRMMQAFLGNQVSHTEMLGDQLQEILHIMQAFLNDQHGKAEVVNAQFTRIETMVQAFLARLPSQSALDETLDNDAFESDYEESIEIIESDEAEEEIFEESEVLDYVKDYIRKRGYYYDDETLYNYHTSLKTRPFVILAGLSGTGKTKLAQLYAEALGQDKTFKLLAVRPNWNEDRYLLGHFNFVTGDFVTEPAAEFIQGAIADQKRLYSLCLDEMNLAHVEYYFSQFLSAMEGDRPEDRRISLMSQSAFAQLQQHHRGQRKKAMFPSAELILPDNLLFTGTINVDETTQSISDKVIDRANTIEFFNVDLDHMPKPEHPGEPLLITNRAWQSYRVTEPDRRYHAQISEIDKILKQADMGLGYRVVREMECYIANSQGLLDPLVAFDLQCKQRILPRIHGTEFIDDMLGNLLTFCKKQGLSRTEKRLHEMKSRLKRDGYTSFWR